MTDTGEPIATAWPALIHEQDGVVLRVPADQVDRYLTAGWRKATAEEDPAQP